jgi:hypothetical protein
MNPLGFSKNLETTLKSLRLDTLRGMKLNTPLGKLLVVPDPQTQSLGLTLVSALDLAPSSLTIPWQEVLGNPEPLKLPALAQWMAEAITSEQQKFVMASPEQKNQVALNAEKARRVGSGTISNRHYDVLIKTEEVRKHKEAAALEQTIELKQMAEEKVLADLAEAASKSVAEIAAERQS